ncbi:hypothetical protein RUM44_008070 [Polyplax serrata]|uniref:Spt20-like SEP domain-containing protein n=1 Tax=Polyplax serrata TaxID=468196 RepID=A0ABR1BC50_POLSC
MHSLEAACNEAQSFIDKVEWLHARTEGCHVETPQVVSTAPGPSWSNGIHNSLSIEPSRKSRVFNIRQRLRELYLEECRNTQPYSTAPLPLKNLRRGSRLLEKLVQRDNLNTLIVNLYPGNKGYSLSLRLQGKVPITPGSQAGCSQGSEPVIETMRWPYSDEELLRCIDNEEIPATLVDLLEANHSELFYHGCVIAEIRDYRLTFPLFSFETHHVLLKPTTQSIINDVNIISSSQEFSAEDRLSLESQIVLATAPPLCLDPNPAVGIMINNLQHKKQRLSTAPLRRTAKKFSQVTVNRKRKLDQFTSHNTLKLHDFIARKKAKLRATLQGKQNKKLNDGVLPPPPPVPCEENIPLPPPTVKPDVFKYAKHYEKLRESTDCSIHLVEEYILETERGQGRIYRIKLSILQRHSNLEYLGELYVDRDYKEGERSGASCRFVLGSRVHANRYIQQFTEIFTEEGRKSVRITHVVPGQQQQVSYTPGMRERNAAQAKKSVQPGTVAAHGKQSTSIINNTQNSALSQNPNLQNALTSPQLTQTTHIPDSLAASSGTINFSLNSQQIQKLQGQLSSTSTNLLPQSSNPGSSIQINSVSHLTSLLANSNVTAPPNVNVHQIQQGQNVIGITGQSLNSLGQSVQNITQNVVNVQNIGITNQNMNNSNIQSLLGNALGTSMVGEESINMSNGPVSTVITASQNTVTNSNSTVHHPPTQPSSKASRPPVATNPAISALVTSLMNSAQQFQVQQAAQQAASNSSSANAQPSTNNINQSSSSSNTSQNPTILSLLNATTPLNINNSNVLTTSHVNLNQQNQKLINRKTITNLLNSRLINQNLSAVLNNNVGNQTLVVNNANSQPLRVTLSSLNQLMNASNQNSIPQNQAAQILNIGNVSQIGNTSGSGTGFTIATTQGNITIATQAGNLTTQTFTIANANSQTFTLTSPNAVANQTYSLNAPSISTLGQSQNSTFTISPNTNSLSPQSFTISPANAANLTSSNAGLSSAGFTLSPTQNSSSQPQTFTVLKPNQNLANQSFTITTPMANQSFTVTNAQPAVGNQAFTITNSNISPVQNKTFQINNVGTTNQTFTITTPVVTVPNQFVNCQSSVSNPNFSPHTTQTFTISASSQPATTTTSVFTVNSPLPSQVFTVNIPSPSSKTNFNQSFTNSGHSNPGKHFPAQNSVLINKNQTFTINTNNQNFTVTAPVLTKSIDGVGGSSSNSVENTGSVNSTGKDMKDGVGSASNNISSGGNIISTNVGGSGGRLSAGRLATCQRRLSNALQQASQNSELNKLLLEKSDSRLVTDTSKLINDKSDGVSQTLSESKNIISENGKLSQALSSCTDVGTNSAGPSSSNSNLGLSMPGLSALLAGTPSADNPIPGASTSSSLLERLTSSAPNATAFSSPPLPVTPQSPNVSALSPSQNLTFQNSSFSTSPSSNAFNSVSTNSPLSNITSPVSNFPSSSPNSQVQFQGSSPNSKEVIGITSPLSSPPGTGPVSLNLQGLSLQGITGLQNVQVSIPGLAVPISLSLNVAGQAGGTQGVLMTSLSVAPTANTSTTSSASPMVLTNAGNAGSGGNVLSLPVAQFMTSGVKNTTQRATPQGSISLAQGAPQSIQLVSSLQKSIVRPSVAQNQGGKTLQPVSPRGLLSAQKHTLKTTGNAGNVVNAGHGNQMLTFAAQQQLQLALQKQAQLQQCYQQNQKRPMSPSSITTKHRRRSNATDSNK